LNGSGAISSLLAGFALGTVRFVAEILDKRGEPFTSPAIRWLVDMNFLHYAIFMFVICSGVLIAVSLMTPAPARRKVAGLTFATVDEKIDMSAVDEILLKPEYKPAPETPRERRLNLAFSSLLLATVVGLWVYFR
jgi:SSS family solute:Na+ symporter